MGPRIASTVILRPPRGIVEHPDTAPTNMFLKPSGLTPEALMQAGQREFEGAVQALRNAGVRVLILESPPGLPDAHFPNNWFSTHEDGTLIVYPMLTVLRRQERQVDELLDLLKSERFEVNRTVRLDEKFEGKGQILEGTGSLVLDRKKRIAYAALGPRTNEEPLAAFCEITDYWPLTFRAVDGGGVPIYHTNVLLTIGEQFAMICQECIVPEDRSRVVSELKMAGLQIIEISLNQVGCFCGNALQVKIESDTVIVLSTTAYKGLTDAQRGALGEHGNWCLLDIPKIEAVGGGSARCMLAEVFSNDRKRTDLECGGSVGR